MVLWRQEPVQCHISACCRFVPVEKEATAGGSGMASLGERPHHSSVTEAVYGYFTLSVTENQTERARRREEGGIRFISSRFEDVLGKAVGHGTSQSGSRREEHWWPGFLSLCHFRQQPRSERSLPQLTELLWRLMDVFRGVSPVVLESVRLTLSASLGYRSPEGLRAAVGKHLTGAQMITSREGTAAPSGSSKERVKGRPEALGASTAGTPPIACHSLTAPCHIPVSSFPVLGMGDTTQEAPGLFCPCSYKATILVPCSVPTYCGHRLGSCLCRLLGNSSPGSLVSGLEQCIAGLGRHWYPSSDQIPSPGEILVSMAMHSVTTWLSSGW